MYYEVLTQDLRKKYKDYVWNATADFKEALDIYEDRVELEIENIKRWELKDDDFITVILRQVEDTPYKCASTSINCKGEIIERFKLTRQK